MRLATLEDGSRDGRLVVADRSLRRGVDARPIAPTLQAALDEWVAVEPKLRELAAGLETRTARGSFELDPARLAAPLPRAYAFIDSSVYLNHLELARALRGATVPDSYRREPLMSLRVGGPFLAPQEALLLPQGDIGLDFEAEIAVMVDDVPMGTTAAGSATHIKLLALVNDTSHRTVLAWELGESRPVYQGKAPASMAPFVVTPDEVGAAWNGRLLSRPVEIRLNGRCLVRFHRTDRLRCGTPAAARRHHHRRRHGLEPRRLARIGLHRRAAHAGDA
jgi:fumarylacetoacetate (FAA) hydrolase